MWLTEFNYHDQSLEATRTFYRAATVYLNMLESIERYALFGAFRSDVSNVGPNATILSDQGQLTDIGLWYLGRNGSGEPPITDEGRLGVGGSGPHFGASREGVAIFVRALSTTLLILFTI